MKNKQIILTNKVTGMIYMYNKNKVSYTKHPSGREQWISYDEDGIRTIKYRYSDGNVSIEKFNNDGQIIYLRNFIGDETTWEYSDNYTRVVHNYCDGATNVQMYPPQRVILTKERFKN